MPSPLNVDLSEALATRLNLQISLSILPVVEEWMDAGMSRWLESVPVPPELPRGERAHFLVAVGSDRSRVSWSAHGHPAGFVPKMADYLSKCGVKPEEVALINEVGEELEPEQVGTWVAAGEGKLATGWHFLDERPIDLLGPLLHAGEAGVRLLEWAGAVGVGTFSRLSRAIGDEPFLDVSFPLAGTDLDDRLATAASAFAAFGLGKLPEAAGELARASVDESLILAIRLAGGEVTRAGLLLSRIPADLVASSCRALGVSLDKEIGRLQGALGAGEAEKIELACTGEETILDLHLVPGQGKGPPPS